MSQPSLADLLESVAQEARTGGARVAAAADLDQAFEQVQEDPQLLTLVDLATCHPIDLQLVSPGLADRIFLVSERMHEDWLLAGFSGWPAGALVARGTSFLRDELLSAVLHYSRRDLFGVERYLARGTAIVGRGLQNSGELKDLIDEVTAYFADLRIDDRLVARAASIAEELVDNAFYHAPVDAAGDRLFEDLSALQPVELPEDQLIELRWGCDGRRLGIAVLDRYGSLERETLLRHLNEGVFSPDQKSFKMKVAVLLGEIWNPAELIEVGASAAQVVLLDELEGLAVGAPCELVVHDDGGEEDMHGVGVITDVGRTASGRLRLNLDFDDLDFLEETEGSGLAAVFRASSQMVVNVMPALCTECIGLVDVAGSYDEIVARGRSIHVFYLPGRDP